MQHGKFKVGDKVKVRPDKKVGSDEFGYFAPTMLVHIGTVVTIVEDGLKHLHCNGHIYRIKEDDGLFYWCEEWLLPAKKRKRKKVTE